LAGTSTTAVAQKEVETHMGKRSSGILITESLQAFERIYNELHDEIQPSGAIERMYVEDTAWLTFEIQRIRRIKGSLLNTAFRQGLENLLKQLLSREDFENHLDHEQAAEDFARRWFDEKEVKAMVSELLDQFQLDEAAIEAEAFRLQAEELERTERMLASAMARRDKDFFVIAQFRETLANLLRQASTKILEHDDEPQCVAATEHVPVLVETTEDDYPVLVAVGKERPAAEEPSG
jgi:hypothetical protein